LIGAEEDTGTEQKGKRCAPLVSNAVRRGTPSAIQEVRQQRRRSVAPCNDKPGRRLVPDNKKQHTDPTENDAFGSAGKKTGIEQPGETGTAGLYATPIHEEGEEALKEGQRKAKSAPR
jgi:hypothetical protein